ncbi:ADP-forming succinate--CoA ligase subunit beta [Singulisphaera acidiphila]|uniref:Succinate--CoA ligase [ADP-forming] subunit beta n=1 Tax=Singulisphaera acidiphila (strain ATCC BAA-1392 / DSM 18658 / VKM B-2454 / MOB10) TaxID=886293 RepID=L0DES5_SINAD|nr:ADP-forming succinate--CoA ligase subunit beta [Singulisphaera acidiphila]AGA27323.1 succinyl-CoA synthetase, beta subunit [Singulisphaera acidiphila DSM 18658]
MKVHEYQAKDLLRAAGVAVPDGIVITSAEEAGAAFDQLKGGLIVVKAQVHAGGRGKGVAIGPDDDRAKALEIASGQAPRPDGMAKGVQLVRTREEAVKAAASLLGKTLVTYQTGAEGQAISKVLITVGHDIVRELYLGLAFDRALQCPVLMASTEGGVEIETIAHTHPEKIHREPIDVGLGLAGFQARKVCQVLGLKGETAKKGEVFLKNFVKLFLDTDASLAEINPLIVTDKGDVMALDCKFNFDDNAMFRHPAIAALLDVAEEDPAELRAGKSGLSYVSLDGNIACLVNGAGLAMSTMDLIKYHGGEPANFLDVGGGASKEQVLEGFRILLASPRVKAVLVNIFGGIMKCDIIASALLAAYGELDFRVPLVVRLEGTNVEAGRKMIEESGRNIITAMGLTDAAEKVVAAAKGAA